jgi:hypothetical protein
VYSIQPYQEAARLDNEDRDGVRNGKAVAPRQVTADTVSQALSKVSCPFHITYPFHIPWFVYSGFPDSQPVISRVTSKIALAKNGIARALRAINTARIEGGNQ